MRKMLIITLVLLVAGSAMAREITPLKTDLTPPATVSGAAAACVAGNNNFGAIVGYYDSWFLGYENYAVPINAGDSACNCGEGVTITTIHMLLALDEFADFNISVAVLDAETDGAGCLSPSAEITASPVYNITGIPTLDYYDIAIPIDGPCATVNDAQFLAVYFLDDNGGNLVGLPITDPANLCFNYNDWGSGWIDVVDSFGFGGDILMWADMECCATPVATENSSFGSIKGLFR